MDSILNGRPPRVTGEDGFRALEIAVAAENAHRQSKPMSRGRCKKPERQGSSSNRGMEVSVSQAIRSSYKSPLHEMTQTTPTCLWNDSASISGTEILDRTWRGRRDLQSGHRRQRAEERNRSVEAENPGAHRTSFRPRPRMRLAGKSSARCRRTPRRLLKPIFDQQKGKKRTAVHPDRSASVIATATAIVKQALEFNQLAPNMIVKIPVTRAGIPAIEEATYRGVSINATVCFTLPQCIAVAEAVERGLTRREKEGKPIDMMGPVCTIMVGRLDDWLKVVAEKENQIDRSRLFRMGGRCGLQKDLPDFSRARLSPEAAIRRVSQSHALERAHRRRRGYFSSIRVAGPI